MFYLTIVIYLLIVSQADIRIIDPENPIFNDHSPMVDLHVKPGRSVDSNDYLLKNSIHKTGPETMTIEFEAFGAEFFLDLKLSKHLFSKSAPESIKRFWTYRGSVLINNWLEGTTSLTFNANSDKATFHGSIVSTGVRYRMTAGYRLDGMEDYFMAITRAGDISNDLTRPSDLAEGERRHLNLEYFTGCFPDQDTYVKKIDIGYVLDQSFIDRVETYMENEEGSLEEKVITYVTQVNADTNQIYHPQMDVYLSISEILFPNQVTLASASACPNSIDTQLTQFKNWRQSQKPNSGGLWKLLTNCWPPPGTVGLAYVGTLCGGFAAGVSNFMEENNGGTWSVNAHEAGHIFGADHSFENGQGSTGGIMDYGDGLYNDVYQFNPLRKNEVCGVISNTLTGNPSVDNCWTTLGADGEVEYLWRKTGEFNDGEEDCLPEKAEYRFKSQQYECEVYVNGEKTSGGDYECAEIDRPKGELYSCNSVSNSATCGDGIIQPDEECEADLDGSCCVNCAWDLTTCPGQFNRVDAAFIDNSGDLFLFNDGNVFRYDGLQEDGLVTGYPKAISTEWSGATGYDTSGLTAAMKIPSANEVYLFYGRDWKRINLGNGAEVDSGTVTKAQTSFSYNQNVGFNNDVYYNDVDSSYIGLFNDCGRVDAAMALKDYFYLFCESFYVQMDWDWTLKELRPFYEMNADFDSTEITSYISAAYWNDAEQTGRFFNAGYSIDWASFRSLGPKFPTWPLPYHPETSIFHTIECASHCTSCWNGQPDKCTSCEKGYRVFSNTCVSDAMFAQIDWNQDGDDHLYLKNGRTQLNSYVSSGKITSNGMSGDAFTMDGTDEIEMSPLMVEFSDFSISAYYYPTQDVEENQRLFTFSDGSKRRITIELAPSGSGANDIYIEFENHNLICQTLTGLQTNSWNYLSVEFKEAEVTCCTEQTCHTRAYTSMSTNELNFAISDWHIGDKNIGPIGRLDSVVLSIGGLPILGVEKGGLLFLVILFLMGGTLGHLAYKYRLDFCDANPCVGGHSRTVTKKTNYNNNTGSKNSPPPPPPGSVQSGGTALPSYDSATQKKGGMYSGSNGTKAPPAAKVPPKPKQFKFGMNRSVPSAPAPPSRGLPKKPKKVKHNFGQTNDTGAKRPPPPKRNLW